MPAELRGPPTDWWTATRHGEPVWRFPPTVRDRADRFATDSAYPQQLAN